MHLRVAIGPHLSGLAERRQIYAMLQRESRVYARLDIAVFDRRVELVSGHNHMKSGADCGLAIIRNV